MKIKGLFLFCFLFFPLVCAADSSLVFLENPSIEFGEKLLSSIKSNENYVENSVFIVGNMEVLDSKNFLQINFSKVGVLSPNLVFLENIKSEKVSLHSTFITVNKSNGKISNADFSIFFEEKFNINGNNFSAPANSRIFIKDNIIKINVSNNSVFNELPSLNLDFLLNGFEISGENITLPNGLIIEDGKVNINLNGILIEEGIINYDGKRITVDENYEKVLIANSKEGNYGSWIYEKDNILIIHSDTKGKVNIDFLVENDYFEMDNLDKLSISVEGGDYVEIQKGLLGESSKIIHKSALLGATVIQNGGLGKLVFDGDEIIMFDDKESMFDGYRGMFNYASIPMEIDSISGNKEFEVEVNKLGEVSMLKEGEEIVTLNKNIESESDSLVVDTFNRLYKLAASYKNFGEKVAVLDLMTPWINPVQVKYADPELLDLILCINDAYLESGGKRDIRIASITDDDLYRYSSKQEPICNLNNPYEIFHSDSNCVHAKGSCHYYPYKANNLVLNNEVKSLAVDISLSGYDTRKLEKAVISCSTKYKLEYFGSVPYNYEGDHLHVEFERCEP